MNPRVRVALAPGVKHSADHSQGNEVAYRLYLREIPRTLKRGDPLLQTALRIGIPIFIPPEIKTRDVRWEAIEASPGELQVKARNSGTVHVRLVHLEVREGIAYCGARNWCPLVPFRSWMFQW